MRIIFVCGCLEHGRDGVGDYTLRLAVELQARGHDVTAIALNDPYTVEKLDTSTRNGDSSLSTLRIPSSWRSNQRLEHARKCIESFNPEWISVQFVIFAFHKKGLPFSLTGFLSNLFAGKQVHFMFHELWIGMASNANMTSRIWGYLQRGLIQSLIVTLQPKAIHTHTKVYQSLLADLGATAEILPLFSNIPLTKSNIEQIDYPEASCKEKIVFVIFGGLHRNAPVQEIATETANYAQLHNVQIVLRIVGRNGEQQEYWRKTWEEAGLKVEIFGELPSNEISQILSSASFGITTTPYLLTEKSGAVAAMMEHGLPIICVSYSWRPRGVGQVVHPDYVWNYSVGNLENILSTKRTRHVSQRISFVATQFLDSLSNSLENGHRQVSVA